MTREERAAQLAAHGSRWGLDGLEQVELNDLEALLKLRRACQKALRLLDDPNAEELDVEMTVLFLQNALNESEE